MSDNDREFNPNDVAAQARSLVLKIFFVLGGIVLVRDLIRIFITPGGLQEGIIPFTLNGNRPGLAEAIQLPGFLNNVAVLTWVLDFLKSFWLFVTLPLAGVIVVALLYWLWNYVIVPLVHLLLRILTILKRLFGAKVKRHVILCMDGTWNYPEHTEKGFIATTNVYKFWYNLEGKRHRFFEWACGASRVKVWKSPDGKTRQIGLYYHGVGNPATYSTLGYLFGGAFGFGAENTKEEAYRDIIRFYNSKDDRITVVGFSRGAAIARLIAAYVGKEGVPHLTISDTKIMKFLLKIARQLFPWWSWIQKRAVRVDFLGVWDTVGAFGISKNVLGIPFQRINLLKDMNVSECVKKVVHLVALDEQRDSFIPTLVEPPKPLPDGSRVDTEIEEVWFPGVHSNVGGGFALDGLAKISLEYMVGKFKDHYKKDDWEVQVTEEKFGTLEENVKSRLRPSKSAMYDMAPRELPDGAVLHKSVRTRMEVIAKMKDEEREKFGCDYDYTPPNVLDLIERLEKKRERLVGALSYFGGPLPADLSEKIGRECKIKEVG